MTKPRKIATCDCETDPFLHGRIGKPFIWGYYDGKNFITFPTTKEFISYVKTRDVILYAHNGGKFDFMYMLGFLETAERVQIINGRIICLPMGKATLVDSFAAVPQGLGSIKKDKIEYWKMEAEEREKYMEEIISYMRGDCVYLHELMTAYRRAAGTKKTIASNALAHAKKLGIDPGTTNYRFDNNYRPFYFGGRTECFKPGHWENISVFDIKSSYPRAMQEYHATGNSDDFVRRDDFNGMTRDEIQRSFIVLDCFADGCFPKRPSEDTSEGLSFPREVGRYHVTGWEYIAAKELGLIDDVEILSVRHSKRKITFADYVQHWYEYKNRHNKKTDPINYTIGKIMMNSLYGKLAQNPEKYHDYKIVENGTRLPCNTPRIGKDKICRICFFSEMDHGWTFYTEFEGKTFHRRESLWKYMQRFGIQWEAKPLYKNVATGASITGYARAALLRAIHAVGRDAVIYCDTDSLVVTQFANTAALPQSDKIGDWEMEIERAPIGHFGGKKLYAIDINPNEKCSCELRAGMCDRHKVVTKGARLTFKEVKRIVDGDDIKYEPAAPSFSLVRGVKFIDRTLRKTSH